MTNEGSASGGVVAAVRGHVGLVVTMVLAALVASLLVLSLRAPTYEASAQVLVTPLTSDAPDPRLPVVRESGDPTRTVQTAANLIDSDAAAAAAAAAVGRGWTPERVRQAVDVQPQGQSDVVAVTASAPDPHTAALLATAYARAALELRRQQLRPIVASLIADTERALAAQTDRRSPVADDLASRLADLRGLQNGVDPTMSLSRPAEQPTGPTGPPGALIVLLALMAGLAAGVGAALLLETFLPPRVSDAAQATAITGLPVLARIPRLRPKRRDGLPFPGQLSPEVAAAFRAVEAQFQLDRGGRRVLLLTSPSSRDPATTSAADFGAALADAGYDVLLIDLDRRRPAPLEAGSAVSPLPIDTALSSAWQHNVSHLPEAPGLSLLALEEPKSPDALESAANDIRQLLAQVRATFDYVLIDAPPLDEPETALRVLATVDGVLLVVQPGRTLVADLELALELLLRTRGRPDGLLVIERARRPLLPSPMLSSLKDLARRRRLGARDAEPRPARGAAPMIPD